MIFLDALLGLFIYLFIIELCKGRKKDELTKDEKYHENLNLKDDVFDTNGIDEE